MTENDMNKNRVIKLSNCQALDGRNVKLSDYQSGRRRGQSE